MAYTLWSQDIFTKGELSPFMYARATVNEYGNGLKKAQNVLTYPTGAAGKRFGTLYNATLSGLSSFSDLYFQTFQYLNICVFQLVFTPLNIAIYLEGTLNANVTTTIEIYPTSQDAKAGTNVIVPSTIGTGVNTIKLLNIWTFPHTIFKDVPVYDFNGTATSYDSLTFTPSAVVGNGVTITVSGAGY